MIIFSFVWINWKDKIYLRFHKVLDKKIIIVKHDWMRQDQMDRPHAHFQLSFFFLLIYIVTRIMHRCPLYRYFSYQLDAVLILFLRFLFCSESRKRSFFLSFHFPYSRLFLFDKKRRAKTVIITERTVL
jgi:hypothetical protein